MSQMYVSHSHVLVDLGKILQCGSAKNKTAKLVDGLFQHKTGSTGGDGARAKGILKQLQSEKFVKHLYFLLDVMKI